MVDTSEPTVNLALSTTFMLTLVVIVASSIGEKVHWPAQEVFTDGADNGGDWGFLSQLMKFVNEFSDAGSIILASLGYEDHITLHVSSCLVVLAVGDLPGEVWDKECRVADPTSRVVENL